MLYDRASLNLGVLEMSDDFEVKNFKVIGHDLQGNAYAEITVKYPLDKYGEDPAISVALDQEPPSTRQGPIQIILGGHGVSREERARERARRRRKFRRR